MASTATGAPLESVRLLHLSDTHNLHRSIEAQFPLPEADILLHTGDFTCHGTLEEFSDFNAWLGELRPRFRHILVICGNHEWWSLKSSLSEEELDRILAPGYVQGLLSNATVLEHETAEIMGIRIFGSTWCPWHPSAAPGEEPPRFEAQQRALERFLSSAPTAAGVTAGDRVGAAVEGVRGTGEAAGAVVHRFGEVPEQVDVLLTHGPPFGIFDQMEGRQEHWGGSKPLLSKILHAKPRVHLFGHVHEQRGAWSRRTDREGGGFRGGVDYRPFPEVPWGTWPAPPATYPCDLVCCGAMANHPGLESRSSQIAGPSRLLIARRPEGGEWSFEVSGQDSKEPEGCEPQSG